jgi:hypothetical protein
LGSGCPAPFFNMSLVDPTPPSGGERLVYLTWVDPVAVRTCSGWRGAVRYCSNRCRWSRGAAVRVWGKPGVCGFPGAGTLLAHAVVTAAASGGPNRTAHRGTYEHSCRNSLFCPLWIGCARHCPGQNTGAGPLRWTRRGGLVVRCSPRPPREWTLGFGAARGSGALG